MKNFKSLTENEMYLISGGRRCSDRSNRREKRERTDFEKAMSSKAERYGRAGKISGAMDTIGSAISGSWGC